MNHEGVAARRVLWLFVWFVTFVVAARAAQFRASVETVLVVRHGPALHAWVNACPHHGTPMAWRKNAFLNAARDRIVCGAHGAQFEIDTGRCTLGPCLGQSLTPVPLCIHDDGEVHVAASLHEETT